MKIYVVIYDNGHADLVDERGTPIEGVLGVDLSADYSSVGQDRTYVSFSLPNDRFRKVGECLQCGGKDGHVLGCPNHLYAASA